MTRVKTIATTVAAVAAIGAVVAFCNLAPGAWIGVVCIVVGVGLWLI